MRSSHQSLGDTATNGDTVRNRKAVADEVDSACLKQRQSSRAQAGTSVSSSLVDTGYITHPSPRDGRLKVRTRCVNGDGNSGSLAAGES